MPNHWDDRRRIWRRSREGANRFDQDWERSGRFDYDTGGRIGFEGGYHGRLTNYTSYPYGQQGYYSEPTWRGPGYGEHGPEYGEPVPGEREHRREPFSDEPFRRGYRQEGDYGERFDRSYRREAGYERARPGFREPVPPAGTEPWMIPGPFTGRGPRGYQRSDERICEDVCEALTAHGYLDASQIEVDVSNGEVTLRGTVRNRQAKRMAEDVAESVPGARDIYNRLRIREEPARERAVTEGENPLGGVNLEL
ncbi:MAG: BON domain-containing protein [Ardenticatenaceae bacterium]|nr:BON domain-containing protein [Ardenticatenaceae bacterium]